MGTVAGDLHDIGKNLVVMMLEGAGFQVVDLGVDVPADKFRGAVTEHSPQLVGMSALLTHDHAGDAGHDGCAGESRRARPGEGDDRWRSGDPGLWPTRSARTSMPDASAAAGGKGSYAPAYRPVMLNGLDDAGVCTLHQENIATGVGTAGGASLSVGTKR